MASTISKPFRSLLTQIPWTWKMSPHKRLGAPLALRRSCKRVPKIKRLRLWQRMIKVANKQQLGMPRACKRTGRRRSLMLCHRGVRRSLRKWKKKIWRVVCRTISREWVWKICISWMRSTVKRQLRRLWMLIRRMGRWRGSGASCPHPKLLKPTSHPKLSQTFNPKPYPRQAAMQIHPRPKEDPAHLSQVPLKVPPIAQHPSSPLPPRSSRRIP